MWLNKMMSSRKRQPVQGRRMWSRLVCMENQKQIHADKHARLSWGWTQEEWMEIRLVRKTRARSQEALIPFLHVIQYVWLGYLEGEHSIQYVLVSLSSCTLILPWRLIFHLCQELPTFLISPAYPAFNSSAILLAIPASDQFIPL